MSAVTARGAAEYLKHYVESYREQYARLTTPPPHGSGYPDLRISPYLYSDELICSLARDGAVVEEHSWEPPKGWEIAGGPTLLVDYPETRTPVWVTDSLRETGILGQNIGIYRIVAPGGIPSDIWSGRLPEATESAEETVRNGMRIRVAYYDIDYGSLVQLLTYGAFGLILYLPPPNSDAYFWNPRIIRDMGFATADRQNKRFYHYLELIAHCDEAAWDTRSIWARVYADIRRDYEHTVAKASQAGATISLIDDPTAALFRDRLSSLWHAINNFRLLLDQHGEGPERIFHEYLQAHPILLDVYATKVLSKERLVYPEGESPIGKEYVEPDFILQYPNNHYKLIELERPSKPMGTQHGQPRSEVSQAAFQIAEWKAYIRNHYDQLRERFPGISVSFSTMIVMSRATEESFGRGRDIRRYMELVKTQFDVDEILLYDDLLNRVEQTYARLCAL